MPVASQESFIAKETPKKFIMKDLVDEMGNFIPEASSNKEHDFTTKCSPKHSPRRSIAKKSARKSEQKKKNNLFAEEESKEETKDTL